MSVAAMAAPAVTERALLEAWEGGRGHPAPGRAIALAALASGWPADEVADLPLGRCDLLLLRLREECFGPRLEGLAQCPACGTDLDVDIAAAELRTGGAAAQSAVDVDGRSVPLRPLTVRDLLECGSDRAKLLARCACGGPYPALLEEAALLDAIEARLDLLDPQAAAGIDLDCPECGTKWRAQIDLIEFVWSEVDRFARRLLLDVHTLASAYGWTEADVLAVSPARRRFYLQACAP
jgi:hypothetical protein